MFIMAAKHITNADAVNPITIGGAQAATMALAAVPAATGVAEAGGADRRQRHPGAFATVSDLATTITGAGITSVTASDPGWPSCASPMPAAPASPSAFATTSASRPRDRRYGRRSDGELHACSSTAAGGLYRCCGDGCCRRRRAGRRHVDLDHGCHGGCRGWRRRTASSLHGLDA